MPATRAFRCRTTSGCSRAMEGGTGLDNQGAEFSVIPSDVHIHIPTGFEPGWIYELVYEGKDPLVLGLGHIAVRDFVSFLKSGKPDSAGKANPAGRVDGEGLRLGPLADGPLHPRLRASRLQRRCERWQGVRRPAAARLGRRPDVDEPSLRQRHRGGGAGVRGSREPGRPLPVLLRAVDRSHHQARRMRSASGRRPIR